METSQETSVVKRPQGKPAKGGLPGNSEAEHDVLEVIRGPSRTKEEIYNTTWAKEHEYELLQRKARGESYKDIAVVSSYYLSRCKNEVN